MNFIIYTLLILIGLYFLLRLFTQVESKKISKGLNTPDIHGTTLLLWAMTMIYDFQGIDQFNVIKP